MDWELGDLDLFFSLVVDLLYDFGEVYFFFCLDVIFIKMGKILLFFFKYFMRFNLKRFWKGFLESFGKN